MKENSTEFMKEYIREVFDVVIELYKSVAPELIAEAFKIDMDDVRKLSSDDIIRNLNNLIIDYQAVNNENEEKIWYHDSIKEKIIAQMNGQQIQEESDILLMHLNEPEVLNKNSVQEIKGTRDSKGTSKIISDIDYISHEMAHAFEHIIIAKNPSYIDSTIYILKNGENILQYDTGESFAISMEKVILDKLKEDGQLEKYKLSEYATIGDIEDVWNKKRIIPSKNRGTIGTTSKGKELIKLDLNLVAYEIIKQKGMKEIVKCIKTANLLEINKGIHDINNNTEMAKLCDRVDEKDYEDILIAEDDKYQQVNSQEEIMMFIRQMKQTKDVQELGKEALEEQNETENKDFTLQIMQKQINEIELENESTQEKE